MQRQSQQFLALLEGNEQVIVDGEDINLNVQKLLTLESEEEEKMTRVLMDRLEKNWLSDEALKAYLDKIGGKASKDCKRNENTLKMVRGATPKASLCFLNSKTANRCMYCKVWWGKIYLAK
jgi:hypothetical protein